MKFKCSNTIVAGVIIATFCGGSSAVAGIIDTDNGSYIDQDTGLEWMDHGINNGESFNYVLRNLDIGMKYEGWRIANEIEVLTLYTNTFFSHGSYLHTETNSRSEWYYNRSSDYDDSNSWRRSSHQNYHDAMGYNVLYEDDVKISHGMFESTAGFIGYTIIDDYPGNSDLAELNISHTRDLIHSRNTESEYWSTFLVKTESAVPEPSALAIFALGLMALGSCRFKRLR